MTLHELIELFITSDKSEWNQIPTWGHGSGPSYKNQFQFSEIYNGAENVLSHKEHSDVASYKKNLSITIAWGLKSGDDDTVVDRPWATNNTDPSPGRPKYLDFFYNNALVLRVDYCVIDGGRCQLPFPTYDNEQNITVPRKYYDVIKKFNELTNTSFFDSYFDSSGMTIVEKEWKA